MKIDWDKSWSESEKVNYINVRLINAQILLGLVWSEKFDEFGAWTSKLSSYMRSVDNHDVPRLELINATPSHLHKIIQAMFKCEKVTVVWDTRIRKVTQI